MERKTLSSGLAGSAVVVLVWLLEARFGLEVPQDVAGALTVVVAVLVGWAVPNGNLAPSTLESEEW
jgi:hypothetical protein